MLVCAASSSVLSPAAMPAVAVCTTRTQNTFMLRDTNGWKKLEFISTSSGQQQEIEHECFHCCCVTYLRQVTVLAAVTLRGRRSFMSRGRWINAITTAAFSGRAALGSTGAYCTMRSYIIRNIRPILIGNSGAF